MYAACYCCGLGRGQLWAVWILRIKDCKLKLSSPHSPSVSMCPMLCKTRCALWPLAGQLFPICWNSTCTNANYPICKRALCKHRMSHKNKCNSCLLSVFCSKYCPAYPHSVVLEHIHLCCPVGSMSRVGVPPEAAHFPVEEIHVHEWWAIETRQSKTTTPEDKLLKRKEELPQVGFMYMNNQL